jgi:dipeptidyl aminopeptidase/acylaminoacyl peptidase
MISYRTAAARPGNKEIRMIRIPYAALAAALLCVPLVSPVTAASKRIDLNTPEGANAAARRTQCSDKDGEPTVYWFHGEGFARVPGERDRKLFDVEGMNVRTCVTVEDPQRGKGWRLVSRELLLYTDPATGELLRTWKNPWTGQTVNVLQTANDPVNQRPVFAYGADGKPTAVWRGTISGKTWWNTITVPLFYRNPLGGDYQKYVGGMYHATEMFNFFGNVDEMTNPKIANPAVEVGWVRLANWLPWMEMGDRAGMIYIHAAGRKLERFDQLPAVMLKEIDAVYPEYRNPPPGDDARENETSWTYFRKKVPGDPAPKK